MELVDRIDALLQNKNMTAKELTERLGLGRTTINDWKRGKSTPSPKSLIGISHIFNVSSDWLLTGEGDASKPNLSGAGNATKPDVPTDGLPAEELIKKHLPVEERLLLDSYREMPNEQKVELQKRAHRMALAPQLEPVTKVKIKIFNAPASAGFGAYLDDNSGFEVKSFQESAIPAGANCGIRISGDSMEPLIKNGSIAWVAYQPKVDVDDIGIFIYNGEGFCKKLEIDYHRKEIHLVSINNAYPPIIITNEDELRTVGKVLLDKSFF